MPDSLICRICLKIVKDDECTYLNVNYINEKNITTSLRELIEECVSEVNLQLTDSPRICRGCLALLNIAFHFKNLCHKTEEQLYNYMKCNDCLEEYSNINLKEVVNKFNDRKEVKCYPENKEEICRTCLKVSQVSNFVYVDNIIDINGIPISIKVLAEYVSSICLQSAASLFICNECYEMLKNTYIFKQMCCETEEVLYNFMKIHNLHLDKLSYIQLTDVLNFKSKSQIYEGKSNKVNGSIQFRSVSSNQVVEHSSTCTTNSPRIKREASKIASNKISSLSKQEIESEFHTISNEKRKPQPIKLKSVNDKQSSKVLKPSSFTQCDLVKFKAKSDLKKPQSLSASRHFKCKKCEYKAYKIELLIRHKLKCKNLLKSIDEINNKKCRYCTKRFSRNTHLKRHEFTHTLHSNFVCATCGKVFAEKFQLTSHEAKHTLNEGQHKCYHCTKTFFRSCDLKGHIKRTVLKAGRFRCNYCKKEFYDSRDRLSHMSKYHTGEELPFQCNSCSFSTTYRKRYNKHKKTCI